MNTDAAVGAADEEAGSIFLQIRGGRWLLRLGVFLRSGGETQLRDQRFGPHPTSVCHDGTLPSAPRFRLAAGQKRRHQPFDPEQQNLATCSTETPEAIRFWEAEHAC